MKLIFYDGECGFCNHFVRKLLEADQYQILHYAPLQGETAKSYFSQPPNLDTVIFVDGQKKYYRSEAAIRALISANRKWKGLRFLFIFPQTLRDWAYDWVAKNRHRLSKHASCPLPTSDQRRQFLP